MAANITSKSSRARLEPRREPYWSRISSGLFVGYRKLQEGEGTWIARKRGEDGKQKYKALGTFTDYDDAKKEAEKWAKQSDLGIQTGGTVEAACKGYVEYLKQHKSESTKKDAEGRFNRLVYGEPFGRIRLDKLRPDQVRDWLNKQVPDDDNPEKVRKAKDSANRNLASLKAALNRALKDRLIDTDAGWRTVSPFPKVGKRRDRFLTRKQRQRIIDKAGDEMADLIRGMLLTFARPGELAAAKVADLDNGQGTLTLSGKTGSRTITLSSEGRQFFKQKARNKLPSAPLLPRPDGNHWTKEMWKKAFREAAKKAKLPDDVVLYSIRHAAISEAIAGGMDSFLVAKLAGTSTAMIDKHYGHLRHDVTRAALDSVRVL